MKIAGSILNLNPKTKDEVIKFCSSGIDYLHLDVMDGVFVLDTSYSFNESYSLVKDVKIPIIIHLMVEDIEKYIYEFKNINPDYIIFHYEACKNIEKIITYLKSINIKVGIAISPNTSLSYLNPYLQDIDMVLIMSVEPGMGGQAFLPNSVQKINDLYQIRLKHNYHFLISVDGGINKDNLNFINNADIAVVGSYLTLNNDYKKQLQTLKDEIK